MRYGIRDVRPFIGSGASRSKGLVDDRIFVASTEDHTVAPASGRKQGAPHHREKVRSIVIRNQRIELVGNSNGMVADARAQSRRCRDQESE